MSDSSNLIQTLAARWNAGLAEQVVQQIAARFWTAEGRADADLLEQAERMRQLLKQQLARTSVPAEQIRLLGTSYNLEQGLARRDVALSLAKNLRHLAERKTDVLHQARAAFLLADAWYLVGALPFSIDWSKRGFGEAKPLEMRGQGGRPYRVLYAEEEGKLALRLALQGGMHSQAVRLIEDAIKRHEALNDTAGQSRALAGLAEVHMLQGLWAESVDAAQRSLQVAEALPDKALTAHALWVGARSAARLGDLDTARTWATQSGATSRQDDLPAAAGTFLTQASIAALRGDAAGAVEAADRAVALANVWSTEILRRWTMLERSWVHLAVGQVDLDEMRSTAAAFAKSGAGVLEAEAWYAMHHALKSTGQASQAEYNKAQEQFERLKMDWHLARAKAHEPLLSRMS